MRMPAGQGNGYLYIIISNMYTTRSRSLRLRRFEMSKKVVDMLTAFAAVVALSSWYLVAQGHDKDEQAGTGKSVTVTGCLAIGNSPVSSI